MLRKPLRPTSALPGVVDQASMARLVSNLAVLGIFSLLSGALPTTTLLIDQYLFIYLDKWCRESLPLAIACLSSLLAYSLLIPRSLTAFVD